MLQAIIFDFDGVIADTERLHLRAFQEVLGERGIGLTADEYFERCLGLDDAGVVRALAVDRRLPLDGTAFGEIVAAKAARYGRLMSTSAVLFDGVESRVRTWSRELPLAIASGSLRHEIEDVLSRHRLRDCFAAIVAAGDVAHGKPAADPYLAALAALNRPAGGTRAAGSGAPHAIEADAVVVIEDAPAGIESARAAGMRSVAVTTSCAAARLAGSALVVGSVGMLDLETLRALCGA